MAALYRQRIAVIGSEQDMLRLAEMLLDNAGYLDVPEDRPPYTLSQLEDQICRMTREDGDANDTFLYTMVSRHRYGDAIEGTCRLQITAHPCGLYTALFRYDSTDPFQVHEWLDLHKRCGCPLMVIQRASSDFSLDKGEVLISNGKVMDNWDTMCECWFWLIDQYGCGLPPEEALEELKVLGKIMEREEYDMDIPNLLRSCRLNLESLSVSVQDQEALKQAIQAAISRQDYIRLCDYQYMVAESVLWETEHNAKWFATLDTLAERIQEA